MKRSSTKWLASTVAAVAVLFVAANISEAGWRHHRGGCGSCNSGCSTGGCATGGCATGGCATGGCAMPSAPSAAPAPAPAPPAPAASNVQPGTTVVAQAPTTASPRMNYSYRPSMRRVFYRW